MTRLERIGLEDIGDKALHKVLERCSSYFLLHEEKFPTPETLREIVEKVPEGWKAEDKLVFKVMDNEEEIGLVDILKNYPDPDIWMISLLLIIPEYRGCGVGGSVHEEIKRIAQNSGIKNLRIGVLEENFRGRQFWIGLGYEVLKEARVNFGGREKTVEVMVLEI